MYSKNRLAVQALIDQAFYIVTWIVAAHMWGAGYGFLTYVAVSGLHDIGYALRIIAFSIQKEEA